MNKKHYIKFRVVLKREKLQMDRILMQTFNEIRSALKQRRWLGALGDGTGFGNLSFRISGTEFLITASRTGHLDTLSCEDIAWVEKADIAGNCIHCRGLKAASSESLSHAACYLSNDSISAVIHIHDAGLWESARARFPVTDPGIEYGTPALAYAVSDIVRSNSGPSGLIVMGGHPEGLLGYGVTLKDVMQQFYILEKGR